MRRAGEMAAPPLPDESRALAVRVKALYLALRDRLTGEQVVELLALAQTAIACDGAARSPYLRRALALLEAAGGAR